MNKRYDHIMALVTGTPWAIDPDAPELGAVRAVLSARLAGEQWTAEDVRERIAAARRGGERRGGSTEGGVGILPLYGVLTPRADMMSEMSGATSMEGFRRDLRALMNDPEVGTIIMDVDSPGGLTEGIRETAMELRAARDRKPIVAVANTYMASAAYYLASQASEVVASPSSFVGSVGVLMLHQDLSGAYEKAGVKPTLITAGKYKGEGNDFGPLSDDALAHRQAMVDEQYAEFVADVAKGRGIRRPTLDGTAFGGGRAFRPAAALEMGLVDRIGSLDETVARVLKSPPPVGRAVASDEPVVISATDEDAAAVDELNALRERNFDFERELYERRAVRA